MNSADSTIDALNGGNIRILLEEYLRNCHTDKNQDSPQESKSKKVTRKDSN